MQKINHQNYDLAFKESFSIFENKTLDFLGLNLPKITEFLETEFADLEGPIARRSEIVERSAIWLLF